jgi:hypothetical protein
MAELSLYVLLDPPFYGRLLNPALIDVKHWALRSAPPSFTTTDRNIKPGRRSQDIFTK